MNFSNFKRRVVALVGAILVMSTLASTTATAQDDGGTSVDPPEESLLLGFPYYTWAGETYSFVLKMISSTDWSAISHVQRSSLHDNGQLVATIEVRTSYSNGPSYTVIHLSPGYWITDGPHSLHAEGIGMSPDEGSLYVGDSVSFYEYKDYMLNYKLSKLVSSPYGEPIIMDKPFYFGGTAVRTIGVKQVYTVESKTELQ